MGLTPACHSSALKRSCRSWNIVQAIHEACSCPTQDTFGHGEEEAAKVEHAQARSAQIEKRRRRVRPAADGVCAALLPGLAHLIATRKVTAKCVDWDHAGIGRTSTRISALRSMIWTIGVIQCSTVPLRASNSYDACCSHFIVGLLRDYQDRMHRSIRLPAHVGRSRSGTPATSIHITSANTSIRSGSGVGSMPLRVSVAPQTTDGLFPSWATWQEGIVDGPSEGRGHRSPYQHEEFRYMSDAPKSRRSSPASSSRRRLKQSPRMSDVKGFGAFVNIIGCALGGSRHDALSTSPGPHCSPSPGESR